MLLPTNGTTVLVVLVADPVLALCYETLLASLSLHHSRLPSTLPPTACDCRTHHGWPNTAILYASRKPSMCDLLSKDMHFKPRKCRSPVVPRVCLHLSKRATNTCLRRLFSRVVPAGSRCRRPRVTYRGSLPITAENGKNRFTSTPKPHCHFVDAVSTPALTATSGRPAHGRGPRALRSSWQRHRYCSAPRTARSVPRGTATRAGARWRVAART